MEILKRKIIRYKKGLFTQEEDDVINESPLTIKINGKIAYYCMRLPGSDEALSIGLLYNEGIISSLHEITDISSSSDLIEILLPQKINSQQRQSHLPLELHLHGLFLRIQTRNIQN